MCIYLKDMKSLWSKLLLGQLYTDNTDMDADDANDYDTCQTKHDYIGSLPNEPQRPSYLFKIQSNND